MQFRKEKRAGKFFVLEINPRFGAGISAMEWNNVVGEAAGRDFEEEELIEL